MADHKSLGFWLDGWSAKGLPMMFGVTPLYSLTGFGEQTRKLVLTPDYNSYGAKWSDLKLDCFIFSAATYAPCTSAAGRS